MTFSHALSITQLRRVEVLRTSAVLSTYSVRTGEWFAVGSGPRTYRKGPSVKPSVLRTSGVMVPRTYSAGYVLCTYWGDVLRTSGRKISSGYCVPGCSNTRTNAGCTARSTFTDKIYLGHIHPGRTQSLTYGGCNILSMSSVETSLIHLSSEHIPGTVYPGRTEPRTYAGCCPEYVYR